MNPKVAFGSVNPEDKYINELMPILIGIGQNEDLHCYGSCFIALPHMAVTAKHVVDYLLEHDPGLKVGKPSFEYWVVQVVRVAGQHNYIVWTIDSFGCSSHSDIAILWLRGYDQNAELYKQRKQWKSVPVTFDPPSIGATVRAFGLHDVNFDGSRVNADKKFEHIEFKCEQSISTGIVKQHYWSGRDRVMYNFPCFEVNGKFESGMSGGLVIDEESKVCGIVCGSLHGTSDDEEHVSYVTMLWPMLAIPIPSKLVNGGSDSARYRLRDLSVQGKFNPYGWERVLIEDGIAAGGSLTIRYQNRQ